MWQHRYDDNDNYATRSLLTTNNDGPQRPTNRQRNPETPAAAALRDDKVSCSRLSLAICFDAQCKFVGCFCALHALICDDSSVC